MSFSVVVQVKKGSMQPGESQAWYEGLSIAGVQTWACDLEQTPSQPRAVNRERGSWAPGAWSPHGRGGQVSPSAFEETGLSRCSAPNPDWAWLSDMRGVPSQLERRMKPFDGGELDLRRRGDIFFRTADGLSASWHFVSTDFSRRPARSWWLAFQKSQGCTGPTIYRVAITGSRKAKWERWSNLSALYFLLWPEVYWWKSIKSFPDNKKKSRHFNLVRIETQRDSFNFRWARIDRASPCSWAARTSALLHHRPGESTHQASQGGKP